MNTKTKQIRTLLLVIGSGITVAFVFAIGMLYYYNPSGSYKGKNVLLAPQNVLAIHYIETSNARSSDNPRYIFDSIKFNFFDQNLHQWKHLPVDLKQYDNFYTLVGNENSLATPSADIQVLFNIGHPSSLVLKTKRESSFNPTTVDFLKVDFAENGDYYRILLREHGPNQGWVYFYHPGIFQKASQFFIK